jgi:hypothetical protein
MAFIVYNIGALQVDFYVIQHKSPSGSGSALFCSILPRVEYDST